MKDFVFRNDTRLFFRNDLRQTVAEISRGHKVMFVYGNGSVKRNGCHNDIVQSLNGNGIPFVEYGNAIPCECELDEDEILDMMKDLTQA